MYSARAARNFLPSQVSAYIANDPESGQGQCKSRPAAMLWEQSEHEAVARAAGLGSSAPRPLLLKGPCLARISPSNDCLPTVNAYHRGACQEKDEYLRKGDNALACVRETKCCAHEQAKKAASLDRPCVRKTTLCA